MIEKMESKRTTCRGCRFWQETGASQIVGQPAGGECHRHPPTGQLVPAGAGQIGAAAVWPPTQANQWCGDFEPQTEGGS